MITGNSKSRPAGNSQGHEVNAADEVTEEDLQPAEVPHDPSKDLKHVVQIAKGTLKEIPGVLHESSQSYKSSVTLRPSGRAMGTIEPVAYRHKVRQSGGTPKSNETSSPRTTPSARESFASANSSIMNASRSTSTSPSLSSSSPSPPHQKSPPPPPHIPKLDLSSALSSTFVSSLSQRAPFHPGGLEANPHSPAATFGLQITPKPLTASPQSKSQGFLQLGFEHADSSAFVPSPARPPTYGMRLGETFLARSHLAPDDSSLLRTSLGTHAPVVETSPMVRIPASAKSSGGVGPTFSTPRTAGSNPASARLYTPRSTSGATTHRSSLVFKYQDPASGALTTSTHMPPPLTPSVSKAHLSSTAVKPKVATTTKISKPGNSHPPVSAPAPTSAPLSARTRISLTASGVATAPKPPSKPTPRTSVLVPPSPPPSPPPSARKKTESPPPTAHAHSKRDYAQSIAAAALTKSGSGSSLSSSQKSGGDSGNRTRSSPNVSPLSSPAAQGSTTTKGTSVTKPTQASTSPSPPRASTATGRKSTSPPPRKSTSPRPVSPPPSKQTHATATTTQQPKPHAKMNFIPFQPGGAMPPLKPVTTAAQLAPLNNNGKIPPPAGVVLQPKLPISAAAFGSDSDSEDSDDPFSDFDDEIKTTADKQASRLKSPPQGGVLQSPPPPPPPPTIGASNAIGATRAGEESADELDFGDDEDEHVIRSIQEKQSQRMLAESLTKQATKENIHSVPHSPINLTTKPSSELAKKQTTANMKTITPAMMLAFQKPSKAGLHSPTISIASSAGSEEDAFPDPSELMTIVEKHNQLHTPLAVNHGDGGSGRTPPKVQPISSRVIDGDDEDELDWSASDSDDSFGDVEIGASAIAEAKRKKEEEEEAARLRKTTGQSGLRRLKVAWEDQSKQPMTQDFGLAPINQGEEIGLDKLIADHLPAFQLDTATRERFRCDAEAHNSTIGYLFASDGGAASDQQTAIARSPMSDPASSPPINGWSSPTAAAANAGGGNVLRPPPQQYLRNLFLRHIVREKRQRSQFSRSESGLGSMDLAKTL